MSLKSGTASVLASLLLLLSGCSGGNTTGNPTATSGGADASKGGGKLPQVGIVFDSGGRGDKSFNDSAYAGVIKAQKDLGVPEAKMVDSKSEKDYETNLNALAEQGCDVIFAVGLNEVNALKSVAPKYPNIKFAIVDGVVEAPNVRSLTFSEEQGSYLAGYAAALATKANKVGFVGGMEIDLIKKFEAGYRAGVQKGNPAVEILPAKYVGSWDDVSGGKAAANLLFSQGADIVYHAAGRCGLGVISAAKEQNKLAIGVDSNQDDQAPGNVLTSMIKHVDEAVFQTIKDVKDGSFTPGTKVYDLKTNGVGLSDFAHTKDKIGGDAGLKKIGDIRQQIIEGKIVVPTK